MLLWVVDRALNAYAYRYAVFMGVGASNNVCLQPPATDDSYHAECNMDPKQQQQHQQQQSKKRHWLWKKTRARNLDVHLEGDRRGLVC